MNRGIYKDNAKEAFKANYWACVVVSLILFIFCTTHNNGSNSRSSNNSSYSPYSPGSGYPGYTQTTNPSSSSYQQILQQMKVQIDRNLSDEERAVSFEQNPIQAVKIQGVGVFRFLLNLFTTSPSAILSLLALIVGGILIIAMVLKAFIFCPLEVGGRKFYIENSTAAVAPGISRMFYGFTCGHYMKVVSGMFVRNLFLSLLYIPLIAGIFLLAMNFMFPGFLFFGIILCVIGVGLLGLEIYLNYSWRLVPYLLADDPTLSPMEVLKNSNEIMNGFRFESFILDLSFILWDILAGLTIYIAGVFWVFPYKDATYAEMYLDLSGTAHRSATVVKAPRRNTYNDDDIYSGSDW